jgi:hypothetical protein
VSEGGGSKYAPKPGHIPGVPINLGGNDFVLAPLGLRLAREASEKGKAISTGEASEDDAFAFGAWMVHQSLLRNYPDITIEEVNELLDQGNIKEASDAIAGLSGLQRVKPGEIAPRG